MDTLSDKLRFPEPCISIFRHIPAFSEYVGRYFDHFSMVIHGRIAEVLAMEATAQDQSARSRQVVPFLIIVNVLHEFRP